MQLPQRIGAFLDHEAVGLEQLIQLAVR